MQPDVDRRRPGARQRCRGRPAGMRGQARHGLQAPGHGQHGDGTRHAGRVAEVVGADGQRAGRRRGAHRALPKLNARAHLRRLPLAAVAAELRAQLDAFTAAHGRAPDFIDGHQHVHALPGVRRLVIDAASALTPVAALRNTGCVPGPGFAVKRWLIAGTGGAAALRAMRRRGVAHNAALVGVYDFAEPDYRMLMRRWLRAVSAEGALLFCHPGAADAPGDPIAAARVREAAYLVSDDFAVDLREAGVALGRVWRR